MMAALSTTGGTHPVPLPADVAVAGGLQTARHPQLRVSSNQNVWGTTWLHDKTRGRKYRVRPLRIAIVSPGLIFRLLERRCLLERKFGTVVLDGSAPGARRRGHWGDRQGEPTTSLTICAHWPRLQPAPRHRGHDPDAGVEPLELLRISMPVDFVLGR